MAEGIFSKFERDELNKITAKSILEKLMNIRQNINVEFTARRLIWELIQNAKDNANLCNDQEEKVDVSIQLRENDFIFSHNKGYFTNEHIRGLIRKYSSSDKDRDAEQLGQIYKTTGRFGTGFMTTHLLSEKVQIESYYKNEDNTFNQFSFWLDRTGRGEKDIIEGINSAFNEAETNIKCSSKVSLRPFDYKTSFLYPLEEVKLKLANIALEEVEKGVAYTLINVPELNSISLDRDIFGEEKFHIKQEKTIEFRGNEFHIYNLICNDEKTEKYFLVLNDEELRLIIPISYADDKYSTLKLDDSVPRLHLDFPMIGTEDLNLPFVINSSLFEPTEPRDGVSLLNDSDNIVSQNNCNVIIRAVNLYDTFLLYIGENKDWCNLFNLARIKSPQKHTWIDSEWFNSTVVSQIREKLLITPIVDVSNGDRVSIWNDSDECQVYFPNANNDNIRNKIWELSQKMFPGSIPIKEHIKDWDDIIWSDCKKFSIENLSEEIEYKENTATLSDSISGNDAISFLNDYYDLLNLEQKHIKDIYADEYAVIPNQLGAFKNRSELYIDEKIDEELKNACSLINEDPRSYLLHKDIHTASKIEGIESVLKHYIKRQSNIIEDINKALKEKKGDSISKTCYYLASLFHKENSPQRRLDIYNFSKIVYPNDFTQKRELKYYDEKIWEESDKNSVFYVVSKLSESKSVTNAINNFSFESEESFVGWLNSLVAFLIREDFGNNLIREKHPILPNQNGLFKTKEKLFLDNGDIGDTLKDISCELGYDYRDELLDKSIYLELPENRTYSIEDVADKISSFIKPILRDVDKRKKHKDILKRFYLWMDDNKLKAEDYFSDLYEKKFLFLEDDDISLNMKKATEFDQLMEEHGFKNVSELRNHLSSLKNDTNSNTDTTEPDKIFITKETLVSLGISSQAELEEAFSDPLISSKFHHTSTATIEMFNYAQDLIKRAKQNIIEYLENHPEYDCKDMEETAPTTLAGILKNGVPIQIVIRPSDNGEVIVYYSSEKDTLDSDNSELWVDNNINDPHILTLGRILKSTGINRIPINMN